MLEFIIANPPTTEFSYRANKASEVDTAGKVQIINKETGQTILVSPLLAEVIKRQRESANKDNQPPSSLIEIGGRRLTDEEAANVTGVPKKESKDSNSNQGRPAVDVKRFGTQQSPTSVFSPRK